MSQIQDLHFRTKKRITDLGEVFTSEHFIKEMMALVSNQGDWHDPNTVFFEPTCGNGNVVINILEKRIASLFQHCTNFEKNSEKQLYAVANAINTLWALDIDGRNIFDTKTRVMKTCFTYLSNDLDLGKDIVRNLDYYVHLACAVNWQIIKTDALKKLNLNKLDFKNNWIEHFSSESKQKRIARDFVVCRDFIKKSIRGKAVSGKNEFSFVASTIFELDI